MNGERRRSLMFHKKNKKKKRSKFNDMLFKFFGTSITNIGGDNVENGNQTAKTAVFYITKYNLKVLQQSQVTRLVHH